MLQYHDVLISIEFLPQVWPASLFSAKMKQVVCIYTSRQNQDGHSSFDLRLANHEEHQFPYPEDVQRDQYQITLIYEVIQPHRHLE